MTTPSAAHDDRTPSGAEVAVESSPRVRLPGVATALLTIAPVFLFFGAVHFMATGPRGYLDNAQNQAVMGLVIFGVGVGFLLAGLVLVGVRAIAQQQLDLLRGERR